MKRLSELQIIELISKVVGISRKHTLRNDDVSTISLRKKILVFKCDMLVQSTDVPRQMLLWQAARKSVAATLSDLACKGVKPLATLVSLAIPRTFTAKDITDLADGFKIAEREFDVSIIGGDTNEGKELVIDCCMVGLADHVVKRSGARTGDLIVTSGAFGYSASGLKILLRNARAGIDFRNRAINSVLMPEPRMKFGLILSRYATSSMDSSDGLAITIHELSRMSRKRFIIDELPTTDEVRGFAKRNGYDYNELVLHGGEEYEIVATIPRRHLAKVRGQAKKARCRLFVIGRVESGKGVFSVKNSVKKRIPRRGWEHLSTIS